ncbi:NnrS family protein [Nitrosomonas sp.]|uniref:NnrS family protein n=1 Tax=Nitrosomonas sp. TaxID=42353 RepID=UPI0028409E93|nr:NnrS family protein [Nitrosomonas sp.]MDR4513271.1 NnrS family protein [Nitrosomonas sp.]
MLNKLWLNISSAPHRSLFLAGALQGIFTLTWWVYDLAGRYALLGSFSVWSIAPTWSHAFLMIYCFFPFFIFGFLFTTYPNWLNGKKISKNVYMTTCLLMVVGVALFYTGLIHGQWLSILGVTAILGGFISAFRALQLVLIQAKGQDRRHAIVTSTALLMGCLGIAAYLLWLLTEAQLLLDFSRHAGIWFFLMPILLAVSHRMIPFFSSRVLDNYVIVRPYWILWIMLACTVAHGLLQLMQLLQYLWLSDFLLALCALYLSIRWGLLRSFQVSLLAVLHIAFAWLSVSMLLFGLQSLVFMQTETETWILGMAPLHALAIGYFASMVLGMASRVTIGHSGRPLVLDRFTWQLFIGFQATAAIRVLPELIPAIGQFAPALYLIAGLIWLTCFTLWAIRYIPIYWRPRIDGKPG